MAAPTRILAAIPPTGLGEVIASRAALLASRFGAALRLASCVYDPYVAGERFADSPDLQAARDALVAARRSELENLVAGLDVKGLEVTTAVTWAYPVYDGILGLAREFDAGLLVAGTFHHSALQRLSLTNNDWQLLRYAECPVLLVRRARFEGYREIMVAVDPMHAHDEPAELDDRLMAAADLMAETFTGRVHVAHCYLVGQSIPLVAPGAAIPALFYDRLSPAAAHREAVERLAARHGISPNAICLEIGDARKLIPELAERVGADLVVMGTVSRSGLGRLLIGSTAEAALDGLGCDVLILKPSGRG